jgi:hypothetical protein
MTTGDPTGDYLRKVNTEMLLTFYVGLRKYLTESGGVETESTANARAAIAAFGGDGDITLTELTSQPLSRALDEMEATVAAERISPSLTAAEDQAAAALRDRRDDS